VNRRVRRLGVALTVLFVVLFAQLNYIQVFRARALADDPRNTRNAVRDFARPRGAIVSADDRVLARSRPSGDSFQRQREYPADTAALFAHVTGFFSFTFGAEGVERAYNDQLAGRTPDLRLDRLTDVLAGRVRTANVRLTIPVAVQQVARDALGERPGAVVALDPRTGALLAAWSFPSYDPNPLAAHDQRAVQAAWDALQADQRRPLLPRAWRERYFPGSTFKVVTAATALATGVATPTSPTYPVRRELDLPQTTRNLRNFGGAACGGTLADALRVSCNTTFAQVGLDLGGERLAAGAAAFGFGERPPLDLPGVAASAFPAPARFARNLPAVAQSAIGQFDVQATPLQMALVAAAIANGGVIMRPHVMAEVFDDEGRVVERYRPAPWRTAVSPEVAASVRDMMVAVVNAGTARSVASPLPGVQVAAKTGTAQLGTEPPSSHAWMIAFAPAEAPTVAVAVLVQGQPGVSEVTGGRVAGPVAKAVLAAALRYQAATGT
jgi:peptidoglycan glycosyltransferase